MAHSLVLFYLERAWRNMYEIDIILGALGALGAQIPLHCRSFI